MALIDPKADNDPNKKDGSGYIGITKAATNKHWIARVSTLPAKEGSGNVTPLKILDLDCTEEQVRARRLHLHWHYHHNAASPLHWH